MNRYRGFFVLVFFLITSSSAINSASAENEAEAFRRLKESRTDPKTGFPGTLNPEGFTGEIRRGYEVARENPGILSQLPCPCACEEIGHENLLDCFISDHASM
jgi:hypothetical protein